MKRTPVPADYATQVSYLNDPERAGYHAPPMTTGSGPSQNSKSMYFRRRGTL